MDADVPPDAMVLRFRPTDPESVLNWARKEYRRSGRHRLSVFTDVAHDGEDEQSVVERLLAAAELQGIDPKGNPNFSLCRSARLLEERGFSFHKDGDPDEPAEHYSVDIGDQPTVVDVERFLGAFVGPLRRT